MSNFTSQGRRATVTYREWDQTSGSGSAGTKVDTTTNGGTTAFSTATAIITVTAVNNAPVLVPASPNLTTITEDGTSNSGDLLSAIVGATISDGESGAVEGLAITGLASGNGTWEYDTGSGWTAVGAVSDASALLLRATDSLRFVPDGQNADRTLYIELDGTLVATLRFVPDGQNADRPLCIALDGTLVAGDILWESLILLIKKNPLSCFLLPFWLLKGKAYCKQRLAGMVSPDSSTLPYREEVLDFLRQEKLKGRPLILATATDKKVAGSISHFLGIFSEVVASDGSSNMSGARKLKALQDLTGTKGFDYMGDSNVDIPLWKEAHTAILVSPSKRLLKRTQKVCEHCQIISKNQNRIFAMLRAMRISQWAKNSLVFLPIILAHRVVDIDLWVQGVFAFLAFSLCASGVYLMNDLLDIEADRYHPTKRLRPIPSGVISIQTGLGVAILLIVSTLVLVGNTLPLMFFLLLLSYIFLTSHYCPVKPKMSHFFSLTH